MRDNERLDFRAQRRVAIAGIGEKGLASRRIAREGTVEELGDLRPAFR